jgi:hypothetical protein
MELGFTLMLSLADESVANHIGERKPRLTEDEMVKIDETEVKDEAVRDDSFNVVQIGQT